MRVTFKLHFAFLGMIILVACQERHEKGKDLIWDIAYGKDDIVSEVLDNSEKYKVQILFTQIDRDSLNYPHFLTHKYRVNTAEYFYPASTVKMPTAFLSLEKINRLGISGLSKYSTMYTDSAYYEQTPVRYDSSARNYLPSIAHYIKKILLVSDNDAYNRLYEFIGQEELNRALRQKGYKNTLVVHRLEISLSKEENQNTNPVRFYDGGNLVYEQPMITSLVDFTNSEPILLGKAHYVNNQRIDTPMDFSAKNAMPLEEMQRMLRSILFPETMAPKQRFDLTEEDYAFIYKYISMTPGESDFPSYDTTHYYPCYAKFFMFCDSTGNVRIFNKVGEAYGFLIDNAYVADFANNVEFFLSAVLQVNENETYNDNKYEYDDVGFLFLSRLGQLIYEFELKREKEHPPDLSKFKIDYSSCAGS